MKSTAFLLLALLLQSCAWKPSVSDSNANASALHDPETLHLLDGVTYQFVEGTLEGRGQRFHSDYSYRRAVIIGERRKVD
jgi:hypothetical protein